MKNWIRQYTVFDEETLKKTLKNNEAEEQNPENFKDAEKLKKIGKEKKLTQNLLSKITDAKTKLADLRVLYEMLAAESCNAEDWDRKSVV